MKYFYIATNLVADDLVTHGAGVSTAMVSIQLRRNLYSGFNLKRIIKQ